MDGTSSPAPSSAPSTDHAASWKNRQSPEDRARLVDAYTPLVRRLAARAYSRRMGGELEFADLAQLGTVGLLEAIDRYTPARGVRFEAYAVHRIEGAILNGLASASELQRQLAVRRERLRERMASLREDAATARSALERLGELAVGVALGLTLDTAGGTPGEAGEPDNAYTRVQVAQVSRQLSELLAGLPPVQRHVLFRHYFQQQAFEEIARGLNLTKGRVSQIHRAGLNQLRERLRALERQGRAA